MLPPFKWRVSRARKQWLVLASALALLAVLSCGLGLAVNAALTLGIIVVAIWQWPEQGPAQISWREQLLWLDQTPYEVAGAAVSIWPCWLLLLIDARDDSQRYFMLWPDSLDREALRQLRVAIRTHSG